MVLVLAGITEALIVDDFRTVARSSVERGRAHVYIVRKFGESGDVAFLLSHKVD